jgi:predicted nucleic acid-binding protein
MIEKYYLDTSVWMDYYEDREGYNREPLGKYAWKLLSLIKGEGKVLVISDVLFRELEVNYSIAKINGMLKFFEEILEKVFLTEEQNNESKIIAGKRNVPKGDVMHAILARDHKLILITRDKHFQKLRDMCKCYKPEEII